MRIVRHAVNHIAVNIYTHLHVEALLRAYVNLEHVLSGEQAEYSMTIFSAEVMSLYCFVL